MRGRQGDARLMSAWRQVVINCTVEYSTTLLSLSSSNRGKYSRQFVQHRTTSHVVFLLCRVKTDATI
jgi:hypothetical protein